MSSGASWRYDTKNSLVYVKAAGTLGLTLGEIRRLVVLAEGLSDEASVAFEDMARSYTYVDEFSARVIKVRDQRKAATDDQ